MIYIYIFFFSYIFLVSLLSSFLFKKLKLKITNLWDSNLDRWNKFKVLINNNYFTFMHEYFWKNIQIIKKLDFTILHQDKLYCVRETQGWSSVYLEYSVALAGFQCMTPDWSCPVFSLTSIARLIVEWWFVIVRGMWG